ncbi:MAG: hypothetical protein SFW36_04345, partial [Leptolyngbyaceae cyanobacterium bins.59]|nr:hypothetical protein [Leptolyngbyaceae cyanobacterium bins.59]
MIEQSRLDRFYGAAILATLLGAIGLWPGLLQNLMVATGFIPHGHCYLWQTPLVSLHATSDVLIGLSYVSISATLAYLVYRAQRDIPYHWMFLAFGLFIVACGTTHFMEVWTLWVPVYWLSGAIKLLTAIVSVTTALLLPPLIPQVLNLIQTAKVSEERRLQLEQANQELRDLNERLQEQMALAVENARLYREAQEVSQMKDDFLAVVSHELR